MSVFFIFFLSCVFWFSGCAEVPLTQRKSLRLVNNQQLLTLSLQEYTKVMKTSKLSKDREKVDSVRRVGHRVATAAEEFLKESGFGEKVKDYKWEFNLIEDDKVANAWCMPGGKVAVYTGILKYTVDDPGLAVVISHEIAHAVAEHGNERMSQGLLMEMGGMALSAAISGRPEATRQLFSMVYGVGASVGLLLPYSRIQEEEADRIGLALMAKAGYDPSAAVLFWERMKKDEKARGPEFLSTHPLPETRIAYIKGYVPEAMRYYKAH